MEAAYFAFMYTTEEAPQEGGSTEDPWAVARHVCTKPHVHHEDASSLACHMPFAE